MLKTFTLNKREEQQITATQGTMTFYITDENNESRIVTGSTFINEEKVAQGISSENKRELPLIEGLFRLELGESIEIEFDPYNNNYDRDSNKTVNQKAYETVLEMQKEKNLVHRIGNFFKDHSHKSDNNKSNEHASSK